MSPPVLLLSRTRPPSRPATPPLPAPRASIKTKTASMGPQGRQSPFQQAPEASLQAWKHPCTRQLTLPLPGPPTGARNATLCPHKKPWPGWGPALGQMPWRPWRLSPPRGRAAPSADQVAPASARCQATTPITTAVAIPVQVMVVKGLTEARNKGRPSVAEEEAGVGHVAEGDRLATTA